ncbi:MAG: SDR family NAD(P)-dependent oxidoreductase, partial [Candidatus Sulfotelmatobacter sp.]
MEHKARTALITGASGGIGYELAKLFAKDHYNLVLVARSGDKLNQVAGQLREQFNVTVNTIALDLAADQAVTMLFERLKGEGMAVDVLVN